MDVCRFLPQAEARPAGTPVGQRCSWGSATIHFASASLIEDSSASAVPSLRASDSERCRTFPLMMTVRAVERCPEHE